MCARNANCGAGCCWLIFYFYFLFFVVVYRGENPKYKNKMKELCVRWILFRFVLNGYTLHKIINLSLQEFNLNKFRDKYFFLFVCNLNVGKRSRKERKTNNNNKIYGSGSKVINLIFNATIDISLQI